MPFVQENIRVYPGCFLCTGPYDAIKQLHHPTIRMQDSSFSHLISRETEGIARKNWMGSLTGGTL